MKAPAGEQTPQPAPVFQLKKAMSTQEEGNIWARLEPTAPVPLQKGQSVVNMETPSQSAAEEAAQQPAGTGKKKNKKKSKKNKGGKSGALTDQFGEPI